MYLPKSTDSLPIRIGRTMNNMNMIAAWLSRFDSHPLSILTMQPETNLFVSDQVEAAIPYFHDKNLFLAIGGLLANDKDKPLVLDDFLRFSRNQKKIPSFLFFQHDDRKRMAQAGLCVNQIGASCKIDIERYSLEGGHFQQLRYKIRKAEKSGIRVREINCPTAYESLRSCLHSINDSWLKSKGNKLLRRLVTDFSSIRIPDPNRRLFIATLDQALTGYILYSRLFGPKTGWFHDLSRKAQNTPDGIMQLINKYALDCFKQEGHEQLDFGFTPLVEMQPSPYDNHSALFSKLANWLARQGGVVYPARSQWQYKKSWRPHHIEAEYLAYPKGKTLPALWGLLKATNSI